MANSTPSSDMLVQMKQLFNTGQLSDLPITCGDQKFPVHKIILYLQSEYFRKLLAGPFKEARAATINLPDDDPYVLRVLIRYFYHNLLDTSSWRPRASGDQQSDSVFLIQVYAIADKYNVPPLRSLVTTRLGAMCDLKRDEDDFIEALRVVDECTGDNTIWDILIPKLKANLSVLLKSPFFQEVVKEQPIMNLQILRSFASDATTPPR